MQSSQPLVSVVIPCYNHEEFVQDAIQSVIDQDYKNIELIIIDDGSQDNSVLKIQEMMESCKKRFVKFEFRSRTNIGLSATLNEALEWCEGKYFSPIASDDIMLRVKVAIQVDYLEKNTSVSAVFGGVALIDNNEKIISNNLSKNKKYTFKEIILNKHNLPAPTQMFRLDVIKKVGGYKEGIIIEDWYILLKVSNYSEISYINKTLCFYRSHDNNTSNDFMLMHRGRMQVVNLFKDHEFYREGLFNINWMYISYLLKNKNTLSLYIIGKNIVMHPNLFLKNLKELVYKKYRNWCIKK